MHWSFVFKTLDYVCICLDRTSYFKRSKRTKIRTSVATSTYSATEIYYSAIYSTLQSNVLHEESTNLRYSQLTYIQHQPLGIGPPVMMPLPGRRILALCWRDMWGVPPEYKCFATGQDWNWMTKIKMSYRPGILWVSPRNERYSTVNLYKLLVRHPKTCLKTHLSYDVPRYSKIDGKKTISYIFIENISFPVGFMLFVC